MKVTVYMGLRTLSMFMWSHIHTLVCQQRDMPWMQNVVPQ